MTQVAIDAEELYKIVMNLYWTYLENLEKYIEAIPDSEIEILNDLNQHMQEVQSALEHDIGVFEKAVHEDLESIQVVKDRLKIDSIYKKLQK